jgi:hypothetical protein
MGVEQVELLEGIKERIQSVKVRLQEQMDQNRELTGSTKAVADKRTGRQEPEIITGEKYHGRQRGCK